MESTSKQTIVVQHHKMNSKKAQDNMTMLVIFIIIAIVAFLIYLNFVNQGAREAGKIGILMPGDKTCKESTVFLEMNNVDYKDTDSDGRPDRCDTCVCNATSCPDTNNDLDYDNDTIPTACDLDDSDSKVGMCSQSQPETKGCSEGKSCGSGGVVEKYQEYYRCVIS